MAYYLLDHRNPHGDHFYTTRRGRILAIVVHITAGLEDLDATDDHSAENTARYAATTDRPVSWHSGSDADSVVNLLPATYTAFHVRGYNSTTYGHEISKATTDWRNMPPTWFARTLANAARHLRGVADAYDVPLRKATRGDLDRAITNGGPPVGFISHAELDPDRRTDPGVVRNVGDTFPWSRFLALMGATTPTPEDDDMPATYRIKLADANRVAWVLPDGTVVDTDHTGQRITDGSEGDGAMKAVYLAKTANAVQVDRAQSMVRAARA